MMKKKLLSLMLVFSMIMPFAFALPSKAEASIKIGDYVQMGTYYGEPILWRCVDIDENGPLMLSDKIICLKPFDAKTSANSATGSHSRNDYRSSWGSNYWADSNMRSWLNSTASAGNVNWLCGNPPSEWNGYNDYANEAGFLTNFAAGELGAIKEVRQKSLVAYPESDNGVYTTGTEQHEYNSSIADVVQNYDKAYAEYVTDKMFLMDVKQVNAVYNNRSILGDEYYIGKLTAQAVANSEYELDSSYAGNKWYYWLRSPYASLSYSVRYVDSDGDVYDGSACRGDNGVRPAFYLADNAVFKGGSGTESAPFVIEKEEPPIQIGEYMQMGTYYGEPILWRCVDIDENGPLMLSDKIICLKPFDAKTSDNSSEGSHSRSTRLRHLNGSSCWSDSNMRSWLNSTENNVNWLCGNPPSEEYVWDGYNDYADEAGFLTNFTAGEIRAIKEVSQKSLLSIDDEALDTTGASEYHTYNTDLFDVVQNYDTAYAEYVTDKMFLMDVKQINAVYKNSSVLGDGYYIGEPTAKCVANSEYKNESENVGEVEVGKQWFYWLRTPATYNNCYVRNVYPGGVLENDACDGDNGVRPAFYLADNAVFADGSGT